MRRKYRRDFFCVIFFQKEKKKVTALKLQKLQIGETCCCENAIIRPIQSYMHI